MGAALSATSTLADDDQQPLGAVACGGAGWTPNCAQCPDATPTSSPDTRVAALLARMEQAHSAGPLVEGIELVDQES